MENEKSKFGVMLDCSRNAVLNVASVKRYIDLLKKIGYNCLLLYTEDTYEIKGEPYFGYLRGRYSEAELKEIDKYARENGIELIPCIQTLAHLNAIFRWNKYAQINDVNDILLLRDQRTYDLIDKMFKTLSECFTSRNVNLGMDEAVMVGLGKFLYEHGVTDRHELLLEHINKVCEIAVKYNFKPMMWSDMFYRMASKGEYYMMNVNIDDKIKNLVPREMGLIYWDYYHKDMAMYDSMLEGHLQFNNEIWFAGGIWTWTGFAPHNKFSMNTVLPAMKSCKSHEIKNIILTCWKDNGGECPFTACIPAFFYAYEIANGINDMNEIKHNFYQTFNIKFDDFMKLDLINDIPNKDEDDFLVNPSKYMLYNDPFLGVADSTVAENDGAIYRKYTKMYKANKKNMGEYGYLCDYYAALSDVLAHKYELGVKTRKYYQAGDMEKLTKLIKEYNITINKIKKFIKVFQATWFYENKPHGFDVEDIRLGGLIQRLISCRDRLIKYVNKEIDTIEELNEVILNVDGVSEDKKNHNPTCINDYQFVATVNKL